MDTSISTDPEELILDYSSPTLIDVIDLTKESPRNRSSLLPSCHGCTENVSNYHITRSSRRNRNVLLPIVLGGENIQMFVYFAHFSIKINRNIQSIKKGWSQNSILR